MESTTLVLPQKPLLRGWSHAVAAVASVILTFTLCWLSRDDGPRLISMVIFGLSMVELYSVSATYHIGTWSEGTRRVLRSIDHANIFVLIAGTYTPLCVNVLSGPLRVVMLSLIWALAAIGMILAIFFTNRIPRWVNAGLYIGMGWVAVLAIPAFLAALPWVVTGLLILGGVLYTIGGLIYGKKWPNPFPRVFGFHEVFHLFVIAGGITFATIILVWVMPFPRV